MSGTDMRKVMLLMEFWNFGIWLVLTNICQLHDNCGTTSIYVFFKLLLNSCLSGHLSQHFEKYLVPKLLVIIPLYTV